MKEKVTYEVIHTLYQGGSCKFHLLDQIVYLGAYRADKAAHPSRLIQITVQIGKTYQTFRYLTNVLEPSLLSARDVVELYRRRWDIEMVFKLLKRDLKLHLLFSGHPNALLQQVYATFVLAQSLLAMRAEVARRSGADIREVSLSLMVLWFPYYTELGRDPIEAFVQDGRRGGFIRPFRGKEYIVQEVSMEKYNIPEAMPPPRKSRYGNPKAGCERAVKERTT